MNLRKILTLTTGAALLVAVHGCVENGPAPAGAAGPTPPPLSTEPIGIQITRAEPPLAATPFRVLLDFERPTDMAFVVAGSSPAPQLAPGAHTGRSSLKIARGGGDFAVKVASALGGAFPGNWTMAGAYFTSDPTGPNRPARVTVAFRTAGSLQPLLQRTVELTRGDNWTLVLVDLTALPPGVVSDGGLLTFQVDAPSAVFCDDVLVINNARTLDAPAAGAPPESGWTIRQGGFAITVDRPNRFRVTLKTPEAAADGWTAQEACDLRARFASATGKTWTIYADGRQYKDGAFSPLVNLGADASAIFARQHDSPAELAVPDEFGRVDRDTPGDRNNDGYNEHRGSYQLIAKGPRFEVTLKPTTRLLSRPVLEIAGLPPGNLLVTVEGQLLEKTTRLPSGNLLIEIPLVLERATTLNIVVK